ncbi:uncharacterized protein NECHADRAFT_83977 [Fusarium vanettenii 77-13-4]|uniref:Uncharacterized protein n=1 Tax=Fusarium vanettenii (strain ATCC MYA-4622 / CBS 123669 / FGSC 9596 / NRRL 45880 / 77-13-4) TaxID=660122 RepID=C7YZC0_FUSV7|nr:uncharacterized protein NECHADRAFT_83977 [Fusarium vanettenii 77-13-4]EEU42575.1 predicted protein [Fusarium vanettenii 77-13-4]
MSKHVSHEHVDQLVNGPDYNPNTLYHGVEHRAFTSNGMPLASYPFDTAFIPQLPGQSVDQTYHDALGHYAQQPIDYSKAADKPQAQAKQNNDFANGFPASNQFPTNNRFMPMNNFMPQNGYSMPMNGFYPTNNFDVTNGFVNNKEFAGHDFVAAGNNDAASQKNKRVMSAQEFEKLDDNAVNKLLNLDGSESDVSKDNTKKTSVTSGVVDPALVSANVAAGNTSSFNLGNLANGLSTPTPAQNGFVNVVASAPKGHGNGTQFQQPPPVTHNIVKTPVSNIDPFLVAQPAQPAQREQMFDANGRPIVAFTAAQLQQLKQKQQVNQPQKSFAPQAAIQPRQLPVQPVRRVGQHYSVPQQNIVNTEQAVHLNKQQIPQQNQQAIQPVAQVNHQQAQPVVQRAPVQVQHPVSAQQPVAVQQHMVAQQPALVQNQPATPQTQQETPCFPQVSASPTKKPYKKTSKKAANETQFITVDNGVASRKVPARRGRPGKAPKTGKDESMFSDMKTLSAQKTPPMEFIREVGHTKTPTPPKQRAARKSPASTKKTAAGKDPVPAAVPAPAPAKQTVAPHPANFVNPPPTLDPTIDHAKFQKLCERARAAKRVDEEEAAPLAALENASATDDASTTGDASLSGDASASTDASDLEETSASKAVPTASEIVPTATRAITKVPSEIVVSKKKRGKQSAVTVEGEGSSQRQSSQNGEINRKSSDHEVRVSSSEVKPNTSNKPEDNIDPQLKAISSNDQGSKTSQDSIHTIVHQAYLLGAQHAQSSILLKTTNNLHQFGTICGFKVQVPDGANPEQVLGTCLSAMNVLPEMEKQSNIAVIGILMANKHLQQQHVPSGTDAITPPASSPASDMIVDNDNENDTVTVSKETLPQTIEQPQTQITDKTSSAKVTTTKAAPTKTTANNKRKSDAEDHTKSKKARTDKSDAPTVQPSIQLILPDAPLIITQPQPTEVTEPTQVTQPAADAITEPTTEVPDTEMVDVPSKSSGNVDYRFGLGISLDFETSTDKPETTTEPEATQEIVQSEIITQPETIAQHDFVPWPESDPKDLAFANMLMHGTDESFLSHPQETLDENREAPQTVEDGLLFLQQTMNQEQDPVNLQDDEEYNKVWAKYMVPEEQPGVFGERMQEEQELYNYNLLAQNNQYEQLDSFGQPMSVDSFNAENWPKF